MKEYERIIGQLKTRRAELGLRLSKIEQDASKPYARDSEEQALEREEDDVIDALDEGILAELKQISDALARIERNEYGICIGCKEKIPIERLEALPYTDRCIACAEAK